MAVLKWDIVYLPDADRSPERVLIALIDQLKTGRAAKDGEEIPYKVWCAATREGKTNLEFDEWATTVAAIEPVYSNARLDELVLAGGLSEKTAERIRKKFTESGESPAPRIA